MSDNIPGKSDLSTQVARAQRDLAETAATTEHIRREEAEEVRDVALDVAATQAAHREVAELAARAEAYNRQQAELAATNARMAANQAQFVAAQTATESSVLRENLAEERKSASNANFGLMMLSILLLLGLIGVGAWYFSTQNSANNTAATGAMTASTATSRPSDVTAPAPPPVAHTTPAPIITVQPSTPNPRPSDSAAPAASGGIGSSDANIPARSVGHTDTGTPTTGSSSIGSADSSAGKSDSTTPPASDPGNSGTDKTSNP